jgi:hypothetical protein
MNPIVLVVISVSMLVTALLLHIAQTSLERWDQRRHADD